MNLDRAALLWLVLNTLVVIAVAFEVFVVRGALNVRLAHELTLAQLRRVCSMRAGWEASCRRPR
jgi:hypothetical protein